MDRTENVFKNVMIAVILSLQVLVTTLLRISLISSKMWFAPYIFIFLYLGTLNITGLVEISGYLTFTFTVVLS